MRIPKIMVATMAAITIPNTVTAHSISARVKAEAPVRRRSIRLRGKTFMISLVRGAQRNYRVRVGRASVWESPYGVGTDLPQEGSGRRDPGDRDVIRHWNRRAGYRDVQHIDIVGSK